ncbi:MAG: cysteine desulfurase [Alphaproteobacteria bacterium]|nr:cysteine desulfurase [Alphaproteobacteria bacterium]
MGRRKTGGQSAGGVYLDYAATTPVAPEVAETMAGCLTVDGIFGNPSSITHNFGHAALEAVETARREVAALIGAEAGEIIWTSGATESINLALKGLMLSRQARGRHLVVSALEHKAVLDTAHWLSEAGVEVTTVLPNADGRITPDAVAAALRPDTALVSLMLVNNETGTITDIPAISRTVRKAGAMLHADAVQGATRLPLDVSRLGCDMLSLSGHKMYGPKGVGALYVRRGLLPALVPQAHGGGQERGVRPGTLPTHQIAGMGAAARLVRERLDSDMRRTAALDERLLTQLGRIDGATVNSGGTDRAPGILNMSFDGVAAESLLLALDGIALATGSACTSESVEPSHVLLGMGLSPAVALSSVRFSFGRYTTEAEIDLAAGRVAEAVSVLRSIAA